MRNAAYVCCDVMLVLSTCTNKYCTVDCQALKQGYLIGVAHGLNCKLDYLKATVANNN